MSEPVTKSGKMEAVIIKYEQPENNELVRIATVQKASQQQEVKTIGIEGVLYPPFAYQDLAGLYGKNQYHDRCMIVKAACTCGLGFTIEAINPDDEKNKENDPEYKILKEFIDRHPKYAHQPFAETLNCLEMDSEMSGDMYLEVVRNNKGDISEVYHMPFAEMLIKYDQSQKNLNGRTGRQTLIQWLAPNAVEFEEFGAKKKKPDGTYISEFIHIKNYNPRNRFYGTPEYLGSINDIANDQSAATYQRAKYKNNCRPDIIIEAKCDKDKKTNDNINAFFSSNFKGEENAGKALTIFSGENRTGEDRIRVTPLNSDLKEASFRLSRLDYRDSVIAAHGVPKTLLSISTTGKLGNSEMDELKIFKEMVIEPRQNRMEFMLEMLTRDGLGITKYRIRLKELDIDNIKDAANFLQIMSATGAWDSNEIREYTGKEPRKGSGEVPAVTDSSTTSANAAMATLNGTQIASATAIVGSVSAGEMPRDSGKNALKIFFNFTDEQAEALLGNAGTGAVVKPDKKKAPAVASTDAEAAALVKALNVLKVNVEKSLNLN